MRESASVSIAHVLAYMRVYACGSLHLQLPFNAVATASLMAAAAASIGDGHCSP
jgi:hypothetical protein